MKATRISTAALVFGIAVAVICGAAGPVAFAQEPEAPVSEGAAAGDAFLNSLKKVVEVGPAGIVFKVPVVFEKNVVFEKDVEAAGEFTVKGTVHLDMLEAEGLKADTLEVAGYKVGAFLQSLNDILARLYARIDGWREEYKRPDDAAYDWYTVETFSGQLLDVFLRGIAPNKWK